MCDILVNEKGESVPVFGFVYGPLGVLSVLRGPELLFSDCMKYPEEVQHALSIITHVLGDYIRALAKTGIHAVWVETLFGCHKQMSKKFWMETEGVHLKRLAEVIRECGLMLIAHSSGVGFYLDAHMETMAPDAISCAWLPDGFSDWPQVKQTCAEKVCIMGHVHPIDCLYLGRPEEVREECKKQIKELAQGGGYVLAPGWEFPYDASLLNAKAMIDAAALYGKYV
jgi:uroporphyrinogen decarboxylase